MAATTRATGNVISNVAPPSGETPMAMRPLCVTTTFCTIARPRPVPDGLVVKNGRNTRSRTAGAMPGPLSCTASTHSALAPRRSRPRPATAGGAPAALRRLDAVANQVAEHLPQQHLVAVDRRRTRRRRDRPRAAARAARPRPRARPAAPRSTGENATWSGRRSSGSWSPPCPSASVSCRMPSTYGPVLRRQRLRIDQPAVAVDRRQAVAELVRDAGGQLAEPRQRLLEPQLLLELDRRS